MIKKKKLKYIFMEMKKLKNKIMNDTNIIPYINVSDRL